MSAKKESVTNIIKPLAAAFLTAEPEEEAEVQVKPQPKKSVPKPAPKPVEVKLGELTKEETRALLKEQLVSAGADEKSVKDAEEDEIPFVEEITPVKEREPEKKVSKAEVPAKKESAKKDSDKKESVKAEPAAKKEAPAKKAVKEEAPKEKAAAGPEEELNIEYGGRSYSREDLVNRALKIWTSKLKRGRSELHNMELYVKPQENKVYYVFNGKRKGSFEL